MAAEVIGRERELEELGRFLEAVDALPAALVLEGSPGIGKTVLWRAGLDLARARGFQVIDAIPAAAETRLSLSATACIVVCWGNDSTLVAATTILALFTALSRSDHDSRT